MLLLKKKKGGDESPNSNDGKMSPALRNVLHPPDIGDRIDSKTILHKPKPGKWSRKTAKKWHKDRQNYTRKKGKKGKKTGDPPPAAGGRRRKKRRKTRKNKRSKKGGYDSCVGKTPTPEEYCANILDIPVSNAECDDNTGLCLQMEETFPLDFSPHTPDYDPDEMERMLPDDDFSLEDTTSGGSRKKRGKTRRNKRSKKRRVKKRKTRKRRKKRR